MSDIILSCFAYVKGGSFSESHSQGGNGICEEVLEGEITKEGRLPLTGSFWTQLFGGALGNARQEQGGGTGDILRDDDCPPSLDVNNLDCLNASMLLIQRIV